VLKDTEKRAAYDRMGSQWNEGQDFQPPPQWDENFEFNGKKHQSLTNADFSDFFEALFGGEHASGQQQANGSSWRADHAGQTAKDLENAYSGAQRAISLQTPVLGAQGHVSLTFVWKSGCAITPLSRQWTRCIT
jgi:curved DNA-binding protein